MNRVYSNVVVTNDEIETETEAEPESDIKANAENSPYDPSALCEVITTPRPELSDDFQLWLKRSPAFAVLQRASNEGEAQDNWGALVYYWISL